MFVSQTRNRAIADAISNVEYAPTSRPAHGPRLAGHSEAAGLTSHTLPFREILRLILTQAKSNIVNHWGGSKLITFL